MKKDQIDAHPELAKFFERMTFLPLEKITAMVSPRRCRYRYACDPGGKGH